MWSISILKTIFLVSILNTYLVMTASPDYDCQQMIKDIFQNPSNVPPIVYADSGKFINDFGDYNNCQFNAQDYTYVTLRVQNVLLGYQLQYMGLCLPKQCSKELITNQYSQDIENFLNEYYRNQTETEKDLFRKLTFYDPILIKPSPDWSNFLVIGVIVALVILGIAASIVAKVSQSDSLAIKAIKCFSIYDNLKKIIVVPSTTDNQNLLFLNGTRVLSIFWIVFGHDNWFRFMNIKNWMQTMEILTTPGISTLTAAAYFAVDTFLWLGAFLITIGMLQQLKKGIHPVKFYFGALMHRLVRIWPTYLMAIMMFWKVAPLLGNGPIWATFPIVTNSCNNLGALWNLLFIDNFMDHGPSGMDYCFGWGWYLAVDFQLFLISPFVMIAYNKNKKIGLLIAFILFFASILTAFILVMVNDWRYPIPNPKFKPQPEFMDKFYYKPYIRASAYMMGCFTGFLYYEWKNKNESVLRIINKIKNSIVIRVLFYVVGITLVEGTIWIIVPFQQGQEWSTVAQAFYNSLNRVFFLFGMFLCIFAAMFGCKNDPAKFILGHKFFSPLAKVSFCIYLTHFIVIMDGTFSARMDLYWEPMSSIYLVIGDIFWSVLLATCLSVMIESPTLGLEKIFLYPSKKKSLLPESGDTPEMKIEFKQDNSLRRSLIESSDSVVVDQGSGEFRRDTVSLL